jgi:hypothetical protein
MFDVKEPPHVPKARSPEEWSRFGRLTIALGVVSCLAGFAYFLHGGFTVASALVSILPLFGIFAAVGWSMCRMSGDGPGVMIGYLAAAVGACGLVASCVAGR